MRLISSKLITLGVSVHLVAFPFTAARLNKPIPVIPIYHMEKWDRPQINEAPSQYISGWWFRTATPLKYDGFPSVGMISNPVYIHIYIYRKTINVPNHQPDSMEPIPVYHVGFPYMGVPKMYGL